MAIWSHCNIFRKIEWKSKMDITLGGDPTVGWTKVEFFKYFSSELIHTF